METKVIALLAAIATAHIAIRHYLIKRVRDQMDDNPDNDFLDDGDDHSDTEGEADVDTGIETEETGS